MIPTIVCLQLVKTPLFYGFLPYFFTPVGDILSMSVLPIDGGMASIPRF